MESIQTNCNYPHGQWFMPTKIQNSTKMTFSTLNDPFSIISHAYRYFYSRVHSNFDSKWILKCVLYIYLFMFYPRIYDSQFTQSRIYCRGIGFLLAVDKFMLPTRTCSIHFVDHCNHIFHSFGKWFPIYGFCEVFVHSPEFICQLIISIGDTHCWKETSKFHFWYLASLIAVNSIEQFVPLTSGEKCVELSRG